MMNLEAWPTGSSLKVTVERVDQPGVTDEGCLGQLTT